MGIVLLLARVLLALVFVVAGLAKLADLAGSRQALRDFGVPAALATPFGVLLLTELAVAVALVPSVSAWFGAIGALVLLLLFVEDNQAMGLRSSVVLIDEEGKIASEVADGAPAVLEQLRLPQKKMTTV